MQNDSPLSPPPASPPPPTRQEDVHEVPIAAGDRLFSWRQSPDQDLEVLYVRRAIDGDDEVVLDPHTSASRTASPTRRCC